MSISRRGVLATGLAAAPGLARAGRPAADLILTNGRIWTVDASQPEAQAIAVSGDRILAVGSDAAIRDLAGPGTRRVDLEGRRVTPGFNDAHAHPAILGVNHLRLVACDRDRVAAIQALLRERAAKTPPGRWVVGFLYDDGKTERPLGRDDLDAVSTEHPVLVRHRGGHTIFVNSAALRAAGVAEDAVNPKGGEYFRDRSGRLNGRVGEHAADAFDTLINSPAMREDFQGGAALISKMFAAKGVTSACDAGGFAAALQGYQDARDAGELRMRIYCHVLDAQIDRFMQAGLHTGFGDERLRLGALKLTVDGSISERTAWLAAPYVGLGAFSGIPLMTAEEVHDRALRAHRAGWQVGVHANGELAIDRALTAFEAIQREAPRRDPRFRLEHCTVITPELVARIKAVGAIPAPFSAYVYFHGPIMRFYGEARLARMFAMRSFLDAGIPAASSSDYGASPFEPMMWLQSQTTRTDFEGTAWGQNQRITVEEAIRCGTLHGARASFEEHDKGSLEAGKLADLVVWDRDPLKAEPGELREISPLRTMMGGHWVFEA